jgi:hyperosmotically inducible protein
MKHYPSTLLCLLCAAACSTSKPAEGPQNASNSVAESSLSAPNGNAVDAPAANTAPLTPASLEAPSSVDRTSAANAPATAQDTIGAPATSPTTNTAPDNTKINKRDTKSSALTPTDQNENENDLKITQHVRQAVMADKSLSFTAKNVKIITQNGKVTLRGPVNTPEERTAIEAAAQKVAGASMVDNQLEVKK